MTERPKEVKRLDMVTAENHALKAVLRALIATHHDYEALQSALEGHGEMALATFENSQATDEMVRRYQKRMKEFRETKKGPRQSR